jgi:tRNA/tmRNA/rRNA uracil-C5-methylase (TrmA/RlmC/RlmD family)
MRHKWAATRYKVPKSVKEPKPGVDYFPLKKSTTVIDIPARPIFNPVYAKLAPQVGPLFEQKFWESYYRNQK